jgi:hypothetical protein
MLMASPIWKAMQTRMDAMIAMCNAALASLRGRNPHKADDTTDVISTVDATTLATAQTLNNDLKAKYNTHIASTTYHIAADATNGTSSANQSDLATGQTLANEMKGDFNAHIILMTSHIEKDDSMLVTAANATDLPTLLTLVNQIKAQMNKHFNRTHLAATMAVATLDLTT